MADSIRALKSNWQYRQRATQIIGVLLAVFFMYEFLLTETPVEPPSALVGSPPSVAMNAQPIPWKVDSNDNAWGYRLSIAGVYVGVLTLVALLIRRWKKGAAIWPQTTEESGDAILIRQRKRVSSQLTLLVVDVSGRKVLVAVSPQAVSLTKLDGE